MISETQRRRHSTELFKSISQESRGLMKWVELKKKEDVLGKMETWRNQRGNMSNMRNIFTQSDVCLIWMQKIKNKKNVTTAYCYEGVWGRGVVSQFHVRDMIYRIPLDPSQAKRGGGHTGIENIHATPLWVTDKVVLLGTFFFFFLQMFSRTVNTTSSHPRTEQRVCVRLSVLIGRLPPPPSGDPSLIKTLRHGGCRDTCERDSHILLVGRPPVFVFSLFFLFFYKHLEELWCRSAPVRLWVASIKQCALI